MRFRGIATAAVAAIAMASLSACGGGSTATETSAAPAATSAAATAAASAAPASSAAAATTSMEGASVSVGSKDFTESILLGKIVKQLLEANGATVEDKTNLKGSATVREAMLADEIDMYWEYTGTAWFNYLEQAENVSDPDELYTQVKDLDAANGVTWLDKTEFNNTYAFAMTKALADQYGVTKMSEVATKVPADAQVWCVESEFQSRPDGWPGLKTAYGLTVTEEKVLDTGAIYQATADGQCTFGEVFATDGRIPALDLVVLQDDLLYFPVYNAALTARTDIADQYPAIAEIVNPVVTALTNDAMATRNAKVDVEGADPDEVAKAFLVENGFLN